MVDRELGDQRQPHVARLAESVEQNDRRTGAGLKVVQSHAVDRGEAAMHRLRQERGRREDDQNEQQKHPACGSEHEPYLDVSRHSIPCHSVALLTCATPTGLSRRRRQGTIEASVTIQRPAREVLGSYRDFKNLPRLLGDLMAIEKTCRATPRCSDETAGCSACARLSRSEERRVGKECSSGGLSDSGKKKMDNAGLRQ